VDPDAELDRRAARVQDPLRRTRARHGNLIPHTRQPSTHTLESRQPQPPTQISGRPRQGSPTALGCELVSALVRPGGLAGLGRTLDIGFVRLRMQSYGSGLRGTGSVTSRRRSLSLHSRAFRGDRAPG
jgi:hypothetical protein